jgi:hypothetical protein
MTEIANSWIVGYSKAIAYKPAGRGSFQVILLTSAVSGYGPVVIGQSSIGLHISPKKHESQLPRNCL